jgi:hypothetical protein
MQELLRAPALAQPNHIHDFIRGGDFPKFPEALSFTDPILRGGSIATFPLQRKKV